MINLALTRKVKKMKNLYFIIIVGAILLGCSDSIKSGQSNFSDDDRILRIAFENKQNNLQVHGSGKVKKLLSDDNTGSRHQRFILELSSKQTLLISHNIDLSTKIDILQINDIVEFYGVYEWNEKGGVIHWTHDDPNGIHENGWLKHEGITYY